MDLGSDEELPEGVGWVGKTAMSYAADESMFSRRTGEEEIERSRAAARYDRAEIVELFVFAWFGAH